MCHTAASFHQCLRRLWTKGAVESPELCSDMSTITSRFSPLKPPGSPVSMEGVDQVVVESLTTYDAPVAPLDISPVADQLETHNPQQSQVSHSVQLSPNRVHEDFDFGTLDVFPVFTVSPGTDGYLPHISPVSSRAHLAAGSLLDEATGSYQSTIRSPATSPSITDHAANLQLLLEPLIPLPDAMLLHRHPALLLQLTQTYHDFIPPQEPVPSVDPPPAVLSREGPFDASAEPAATSGHPLISVGLTGCHYRMTTYREDDLASVDTSFGVQVHHHRFLECVGAPESARWLGLPPSEWLSVMDRQDAIHAGIAITEGRQAHVVKPDGATPVCDRITLHVDGGPAQCLGGSSYIPFGSGGRRCTSTSHLSDVNTDGSDGTFWRPPVGPVGPGPDTAHHDEDCPVCTRCHPRPSG